MRGSHGGYQDDSCFPGRYDLAVSLRDSARSSYVAKDYRASIVQYTKAAKFCQTHDMGEKMSNLLAVLLANRAAGLLMVGAYHPAVMDCTEALKLLTSQLSSTESSESGPHLKPKLFMRLGRSHLRLGEPQAAIRAFDRAIETVDKSLAGGRKYVGVDEEQVQKSFRNIRTEAFLGKTEAFVSQGGIRHL